MDFPEVRHCHIRLNGSITHIVQYGRKESILDLSRKASHSYGPAGAHDLSTKSTDPTILDAATEFASAKVSTHTEPKQLIIFVPGNPGILGIYHDFLVKLYGVLLKSKKQIPVIVGISHNDFDHPNDGDYNSCDKLCIDDIDLNFVERSKVRGCSPHDVELQILNKLIILRKVIGLEPGRYKTAFVGHSIGCYVILRLLQDKLVASTHAGSILIHPALENLAMTIKGAKIKRWFDFKLDLVLRYLAYVGGLVLPQSLRMSLVERFCSPQFIEHASISAKESIAQLGCYNEITALVEMARSEFSHVRDLDHDMLIRPHISRLMLIYATGDEWVNHAFKEQLVKIYPGLHVEEEPTMHAFVMDHETVRDYSVRTGYMLHEIFERASDGSRTVTPANASM